VNKPFGRIVAIGNLEYGWGGLRRCSRRVPVGFKGRHPVRMDMDLGPSETEHEETWHMI